jgi:hypothetical protein
MAENSSFSATMGAAKGGTVGLSVSTGGSYNLSVNASYGGGHAFVGLTEEELDHLGLLIIAARGTVAPR